MRKFKTTFSKFRNGQAYFERSITEDMMLMLLILCDDVIVTYRKNRNQIAFKLEGKEFNRVITVNGVPDYIAKKFLNMEEWK